MYETKEIRTSDDFFRAIDNGFNIYVNTSGKLVAYSSALSDDRVKETISVNPVFIRETFTTFFETTLHDLLHSQYAEALHKFFQKYLETHSHFTLEGSNALKREMRSLVTSIKTEQIRALYKMIPKRNFSVDDTEEFFREVSKIPYYTLLRITGMPNLQKDFQQCLPSVDKITVEECIKVIEYFAQGFQASDSLELPPSSVQGKWIAQEYSTQTAQKKNQKNDGEILEVSSHSEEVATPSYEPQTVYTPQYEESSPIQESSYSNETIEHESAEESPYYYVQDHEYDQPMLEESPQEAECTDIHVESSPNLESEPELPLLHNEGNELSHEENGGEHTQEDAYLQEEPNYEQDNQDIVPIVGEERYQPEELMLVDESQQPDTTQLEHDEYSTSPVYSLGIEETPHDEGYEVVEYPEELALPYEDHHLFTEEQQNEEVHSDIQNLDVSTHYDELVDESDIHVDAPLEHSEKKVLFSYDEFIGTIASLESFVVNHVTDFPEVNELFMNEMYTLLAFIAQYHGYNITRQQSKFELLQHATAVCIRYEAEKEEVPYVRILVLLTLALQSISELQHKEALNNEFLQLLYTLSENSAVVEQYQALHISEYEQALIYASLHSQNTPIVDIEQFLLHANTVSAISIVKELRHNIYSAHFFAELSSLPFDDLQHLEEYYSAYYYQMLLFQYGEEFKPYIPSDEYNSHMLFHMIYIVESLYSYVFTDEKQMEHCGKGILSILIETYSIYVNDTSRPFIVLFEEIANRFRE